MQKESKIPERNARRSASIEDLQDLIPSSPKPGEDHAVWAKAWCWPLLLLLYALPVVKKLAVSTFSTSQDNGPHSNVCLASQIKSCTMYKSNWLEFHARLQGDGNKP
jgi:hypothetical protein